MQIGGVLLAPGTVLVVAPDDYLDDDDVPVMITVERILCTYAANGREWVAVEGMQRPESGFCWRPRQLTINVKALKRCMTVIARSAAGTTARRRRPRWP